MFYLNMNALIALAGMIFVLSLTRKWSWNKRILLLVFNFCFLLFFSKELFLFYLGYTLLNYLAFLFLSRVTRLRRFWFVLFIALNVACVCLVRFHEMKLFEHPWLLVFAYIGLIYNVLKVIDGLYFAYFFGNEMKTPVIDYFNFVLFVPTFTSGPILKFRDFMTEAKEPYSVDAAAYEAGVKRVILGMFKKIVVFYWMMQVFQSVLKAEQLHTHESLFLMVWFYAMVYFDFSGYSDIAVGVGRMMGYTVPENFKKPFSSPTLTQYWRNWHATLGDWFRDHIFMFFSRKTPSRWTGAALSLLIMVLIGLWHGFTWLYLLWGVYHGILLGLESLLGLSTVIKRKVSKPYFYFRCAVVQLLVIAMVIVYGGDASTVLRIYSGLFHWPTF